MHLDVYLEGIRAIKTHLTPHPADMCNGKLPSCPGERAVIGGPWSNSESTGDQIHAAAQNRLYIACMEVIQCIEMHNRIHKCFHLYRKIPMLATLKLCTLRGITTAKGESMR